jgi:hypothetical protein
MLFGEITCGDDAGLRTEPALPRKGTMDANHSLIAELEDAIESGSKDKRIDTLRRITDLFVADPIGLMINRSTCSMTSWVTSSREWRERRSRN